MKEIVICNNCGYSHVVKIPRKHKDCNIQIRCYCGILIEVLNLEIDKDE